MARRLAAIAVMAVIWGLTAVAALAINAKVNADNYWDAKQGYLIVAVAVVAAFALTEYVMTQLRLTTPYEPD